MKQYKCTMWLGFSVPDTDLIPKAKAALNKIFPAKAKARWHDMRISAENDRAFLDAVNKEFLASATQLKDCPKGLVAPFEFSGKNEWRFNPRLGLWEEGVAVGYKNPKVGRWRFDVGGDRDAYMYVYMSASVSTQSSKKTKRKSRSSGKTRRSR